MKKIASLFITIISLLFFVSIFNGCEGQQSKDIRLSKERVGKAEKQKEYLEQFYRREAVLLSLKYKVDEESVFNIIVEEEDILYKDAENMEDLDDFIFGKNLKERVRRYSEKYNIPADIIASILIDYEAKQSKPSD